QLERLAKRLEEKGYQFEVSEKALDLIAQVGFDPVYGARPLKRAIQQYVENPLAKSILAGQILPDKIIQLIVSNDQIIAHQ
ncbi:hypothetical protein ACPV51_25685, partial [Vibrio astriarenae]